MRARLARAHRGRRGRRRGGSQRCAAAAGVAVEAQALYLAVDPLDGRAPRAAGAAPRAGECVCARAPQAPLYAGVSVCPPQAPPRARCLCARAPRAAVCVCPPQALPPAQLCFCPCAAGVALRAGTCVMLDRETQYKLKRGISIYLQRV